MDREKAGRERTGGIGCQSAENRLVRRCSVLGGASAREAGFSPGRGVSSLGRGRFRARLLLSRLPPSLQSSLPPNSPLLQSWGRPDHGLRPLTAQQGCAAVETGRAGEAHGPLGLVVSPLASRLPPGNGNVTLGPGPPRPATTRGTHLLLKVQ